MNIIPLFAVLIGGPILAFNKDINADVDIDIDLSLPDIFECYINWGDGNSSTVTGPQVSTTYNHVYGDANAYKIKITGDIGSITYFKCENQPISGDIARWAKLTNLEKLYLNTNSMSGDIGGIGNLTSLTVLNASNNSISGDIAGIANLTSMDDLRLVSNSVSGDIADLAPLINLTDLRLLSSSINMYTQGTLPDWDACNIDISNLGLSQQEVDDFLCDLNTSSDASIEEVDISGTNAPPSATGLTCKTALEGKGRTVTVST